jgi:Tol biopolymer transport system component
MSLAVFLSCLLAAAPAQSVRLNPVLKNDRDVTDFSLSPDGRWAAYLADLTYDGEPELVTADVRGDKRVRSLVKSPLGYAFTSDSRRIVFRSSEGIFSVEVEGRTPPVLLTTNVLVSFWVVPGGAQVVFRSTAGLFRVPIDGHAAPALVHANTPFSIHPASVAFSPDGQRVTYVTEGSIGGTAGSGHVYSAPLDGSTPPVVLNGVGSRASIESFLMSPDGERVLFRRGDLLGRGTGLMSVPLDGSAPPVVLTPTLPAGANLFSFFTTSPSSWDPRIAAGGTRVVYSIDAPVLDQYELYSAPLDGSTSPVQISTAPFDPPLGYPKSFRLTHDGQQALYMGNDDLSRYTVFYVVPVAGGVPARRVNAPLIPEGAILALDVSADDQWVAYVADQEVDGLPELYLVPLDGSAPARKLSVPPSPVSPEFQFLPDSSGLVYATYQPAGSQNSFQLFGVSLQSAEAPIRLDGPMVPGGSVQLRGSLTIPYFDLALDGARLLYLADQAQDERFELFSVALGTRGPRLR